MILIPVYYGIRPSSRLEERLAELPEVALLILEEPFMLETQDDPDRTDDTVSAVKVVFSAYLVEMMRSVDGLGLVFEHIRPTVEWFDEWWTCDRYVASGAPWGPAEEIEHPAQVTRAFSLLERARERPGTPTIPGSPVSDGDDIQLTIAHPFGDIEVSLATWIETGPGPREMVRPIAARRKSNGEVLPLSVIPLQFRNDEESRRLIASSELTDPWKKHD